MASWVPIVVIIFAVVLVIGPVMWLKPSSRDRKLAELRQRAGEEGPDGQNDTRAFWFCRLQHVVHLTRRA